MEQGKYRAYGTKSEDFSNIYTYIEFFEAISELTLDDIHVEVAVGFKPKDLLIAYSILFVITLLGVVGNVLSIIVWTQPQLKSTSAILLTTLAFCDIIVLISSNTWQFLATLIIYYRTEFLEYFYYNIFSYVVVWMDPFIGISVMASTYLTVAITIERYLAVCHPFKYQELISYTRAWKTAATVIIVSFLYNLSSFWTAEVLPQHNYERNMITYGIRLQRYGDDRSLIKEFYSYNVNEYIYTFVTYILPLASIVIFNVAMFRELRKEKKERELTDHQKKERRLTMMLVYVVVEFAVCTAVIGFTALCAMLSIGRNLLGFDLFWTAPLMVFSSTFNSSVNFVTYIKFGGPFRKTFLEMFHCCRCRWVGYHHPKHQNISV